VCKGSAHTRLRPALADTPTTPGAADQRDALEEAGPRLPARLAWLTAGFPRPRFVDREGPSSELHAVQGVNGTCCRPALWHFDEAKAAGAPGLAVRHNLDRLDCSIRLKRSSTY
jgi:hypothetical protein